MHYYTVLPVPRRGSALSIGLDWELPRPDGVSRVFDRWEIKRQLSEQKLSLIT